MSESKTITRDNFLAAYKRKLELIYDFDENEIGYYFTLMHVAMSRRATEFSVHAIWNYTGRAIYRAWEEIGGTDKPNTRKLKALQ